jgi:hypothetical protein
MVPTPLPGETHFEINDLERRAWPRFQRRIRVLFLPDDCALDEPYGGWIVNGSRGGVRLVLQTAGIAEGTVLSLRLPKSHGDSPWIPVRVLNLTMKEGEYELGCEFLRPVLQETAVLFHS